jgi:LmbE family N-acetylglucosaminyl deacetylase
MSKKTALKSLAPILRHYERLFETAPSTPAVSRYWPDKTVVILSPHPDDEVLSGGLALRLQIECHCRVVNIAVTLGSNSARKRARRLELLKATKQLGWENIVLPEDWKQKKSRLFAHLKKLKPVLVIAPHLRDHHPAHEKTAALVLGWLKQTKPTTSVAWAEYWAPQAHPNLLLEIPRDTLLQQIRALECHVGEVSRNPYHLRLPAWQMDNVRRGSEWLAGKGAVAAGFPFGQLYRVERWHHGKGRALPVKILGRNDDPSDTV